MFLNIKHEFCFTLQRFSETFLILRRNERHTIINAPTSPCTAPVILDRFLMKLDFFRLNFEKYSSIKFHENRSNGDQVVPYGRTDGRTFMAEPMVAFRNFTNAPKIDGNKGRTNNSRLCFSYCAFSYIPYLTNKNALIKM